MPTPSRISIVRCQSYKESEVLPAVEKAVGLLGGIEAFVKKGNRVLLKPNLLTAKPPDKAVTTHPSIVKAVIVLVKKAGGLPFIGDSPSIGNLRKVAEKTGIARIAQEEGAELVEFSDSVSIHGFQHKTFQRMEVAKEALEADVLINLPKVKTHQLMYLSLSVKNLFGCVPGKRKLQWHLQAGDKKEYFAQMLLELHDLLKPKLTIVDGIVGMEGNGPSAGDTREIGLILGGTNCLSLDVVIGEILGIKREYLWTTKVAEKKGIPEVNLKEIEILGEDISKVRIKGFKLPKRDGGEIPLPGFIKNFLKDRLTSKPAIDHERCSLCRSCLEACPPKVISLEKKKAGNQRLRIDYNRCIRCYCCQEICPEGTISIKQGKLSAFLAGRVHASFLV